MLPGTKAEDLPFALGIDRGGEWIPPITAKLESSYVLSTAIVTTVSYSTRTMCAQSTLGVGRGDEVGAKDCPVMVTLVDKITDIAIATTTRVSVETVRGGVHLRVRGWRGYGMIWMMQVGGIVEVVKRRLPSVCGLAGFCGGLGGLQC